MHVLNRIQLLYKNCFKEIKEDRVKTQDKTNYIVVFPCELIKLS